MHHSTVVNWLLTTPRGRSCLREALCYLPNDLEAEFLERWRPVHVLVKCYRGGEIEVFGPRCVQVKVLRLGRFHTFPEHEIQRDAEVDALLEEPYKEVNWPSCIRGGE